MVKATFKFIYKIWSAASSVESLTSQVGAPKSRLAEQSTGSI